MPLLHKLNLPPVNVGETKEGEPVEDCKWLLRAGHYIKTESGYMERIGDSDKVYCMYTCTELASKMSRVEYDRALRMSCCPHMNEINNTCPIIEQARVLEAYYESHRTRGKNSI